MEDNKKIKGLLIDTTKCIGCRGCQTSCKQWNNLPAEETEFFGGDVYQNPANLSGATYSLVKYHELVENNKFKNIIYRRVQCQHCFEPACASACLVSALKKNDNGPVTWDKSKCIGCRYCMLACPYNVPKYEWSSINPAIRKCTLCYDRIKEGLIPACAKTCPTKTIIFGDRDELLKTAEKRLKESPGKYYQHIYGKEEVGGTCVLNISGAPLELLDYPEQLTTESLGNRGASTMKAIPTFAIGLGAAAAVIAIIADRKNKVAESKKTGGKNE